MLPHLPSQTTLLHSSKGSRRVNQADTVYAKDPRVDLGGQAQGPIYVLCKYAGHKSVYTVI